MELLQLLMGALLLTISLDLLDAQVKTSSSSTHTQMSSGTKISKAPSKAPSKASSGTKSSPFSRVVEKMCGMPQSPMSGSVKCSRTSTEQRCIGQCMSGYEFPDKATTKEIICYSDGTWTPSASFPDCEPICDPPCENGGVCVGSNQCLCAGDYWGKQCDIPRSICNIQENRFLSARCNGTQDLMSCTISCPVGMQFEYPPASVYQCNTDGRWDPPNIPSCTSENMVVHPIHVGETQSMVPSGIHVKTTPEVTRNGQCITWGGKHFQTFDGKLYSFDGSCTYVLAKDCEYSTFTINIDLREDCTDSFCSPEIQITVNDEHYFLRVVNDKPSIFWDNNMLPVPAAVNNIVVEKVSHYLSVDCKLGFMLLWDGQSLVQIEIETTLQNKTCGLCGRYDGSSDNDLETLDGHLTNSVLTFADSWKMNSFGDHCPVTSYEKDTCALLPADVMTDAQRHCSKLKNPEYASCLFLLDPEPYIDACISEYCSCHSGKKECGCTSISVYFKECQRLGGKLLSGWRRPDFCNKQCSNGMEYKDCGSVCPPSCANPGQECSAEWCIDDCFCPEGMLIAEDNQCYKPQDCPCLYQNKEYAPGSTVQQDCNNCMCVGGHWKCSQEVCPARCSSIGDPHYVTFDGKHFDFMGKCSYYLVSHSKFYIQQENVACDGAISADLGYTGFDGALKPSCTKTVTIRTEGSELHMKRDYLLVLNGRELTDLPKSSPGMYIYMASSSFIKVELVDGISVMWDGKARLYVDISPHLKDQVQGLCGTFSLTQKDDFKTPEGDVESSVAAFANKWKIDEQCADVSLTEMNIDPCTAQPQLREDSLNLCSKIRSDLFSACHQVVDPEPFFRNCMYDMCSCKVSAVKDCFCPTIADYAAACAMKGSVIEWRKEVQQCEISCNRGQVYSQCGSTCGRSCKDLAHNPTCEHQCVEGCNCPNGLTIGPEGECIPVADCPCFLNDKEYPAGYVEIRGKESCECYQANWNCRPATPEEIKSLEMESIKSVCDVSAKMEVTDCLNSCPVTCSNHHNPPTCQTVSCKPGCQCKSGFILDQKSKQCVRSSECPCHHNDRSYKHGETMHQDCNLCLCEGGQWNCQQRECPGICSSWGENHINTFDGRIFEFKGECEYTLAKGKLNGDVDFTINIQNMPCGSSDVTCFKSVTFIINSDQLQLAKGKPLPEVGEESRFLVRKVGLFIVVHTDIGITLYWDEGTRLYIKAHETWKQGLTGLCGDFNGNEIDDFRSPLGGPILVQPSAFANSWKVHSFCPDAEPMVDSCEINHQRQSWAANKCSVLTSDLFSSCHSDIPVQPYLERCISDSCACDIGGDCECTCTAIAAYAQECSIAGKNIQWRSQQLCPIQCRTCDKYVPCMSVCPPTTCETKNLYKELNEVCKQEICVEGCEPPACSGDEIFKDDKDFECIPKAECVQQPCKVVNGKMYHEGERISDATIAKPCQSCHCINGEVDCVGEPCELPEITTRTAAVKPTTVQQVCNTAPHWSNWINSYTPTYDNGGDYENLADLLLGSHNLCPLEYITSIECRTVGSHELVSKTQQLVHCSLPKGLICENDNQKPNPLCRDYEIRVYCDCEKKVPPPEYIPPAYETTTSARPSVQCTAPGWTNWMISTVGYADILSLRDEFSFCGEPEILHAECRDVAGKKSSTYFDDVTCSKEKGLSCLNDQDKCDKFEIRFYCRCKESECDAKLGMESGSISNTQISASTSMYQQLEGQGARLNGETAWSPTILSESEWIQVDLEEDIKLTGILTQGSPTNEEWVTHFIVEFSTDGVQWTQVQEGGENKDFVGNVDATTIVRNDFAEEITARYIRIFPTDWIHGISLRFELLGCNPLVQTTFPTTIPTPRPTPFPSQCVTTGWTKWMNSDAPDNNLEFEVATNEFGDQELTSHLRYVYSFCDAPSTASCREVGSKVSHQLTGQKVSCDSSGLRCLNSEQANGECLDYEISFYCECGEITTPATVPSTTPTTTTTPIKRIPCDPNTADYTDWMDVSDPVSNSKGDIESMQELRSKYEFCKSEYITSIECRTRDEQLDYAETMQTGLVCDKEKGFECLHSQQSEGVCKDYEVRFYCLCKELIEPITTTKIPEIVLAENATTIVATITAKPLCSEWTEWVSLSTPIADKEEESVADLLDICPNPIQIQCREVDTLRDYTTFTDLILRPNCTMEGIACDNYDNNFECPDFEISVLCECPASEEVTTPILPTIPPVCSSTGWTPWFDIDNPDSGGGDFERLEELRKHYEFCKPEEITDVRCELVSQPAKGYGGDNAIESEEVKCTKEFGLECYNSLQPSGQCSDYQISFFCTCEEVVRPVLTETPPPIIIPFCDEWTDWYDTDQTDDGIEEEFFFKTPNFDKLCPIIKKVECVDYNMELSYDVYPGLQLDERCTEKGIRCVGSNCRDFKIRAFCECAPPTPPVCEEGWTDWFDVDDPHTDDGDFETLTDLRGKYKFCTAEQIVEVECRSITGQVDYKNTGDYAVKCNKDVGVVCYNHMQTGGKQCNDYEIRFKCSCGPTTPTPAITYETTPYCPDGSTWSDCGYNCSEMCHSFLLSNLQSGECPSNGEEQCIPACVTEKCKSPYVWRDKNTCVTLEQCTCALANGKILGPGEVVDVGECERCQCLYNELICKTKPNCPTIPTKPSIVSTTEYFTTPKPPKIVQPVCWTNWLNVDTPEGYGDTETLDRLRERYEFCDEPVKIECRVAETLTLAEDTDEDATCDVKTGLRCQNGLIKGKGKRCSDYEVRFYCPCENATTLPAIVTPTVPRVAVGPCVQGFTDWFSAHEPDKYGEFERMYDIRAANNLFCSNEYVTSIECRDKDSGKLFYETADRHTQCTLQQGFSCKNADQLYGATCGDYEVRYFCDCPQIPEMTTETTPGTKSPKTTTTSWKEIITSTRPPTTKEVTTPAGSTTLPPTCAYWSHWINDGSPEGPLGGDFELVTGSTLHVNESFCLEGVISDIECVEVQTGRNYDETGDEQLSCDVNYGFSCLNENQPNYKCKDYKIRYYCTCETTIAATKSTPSTAGTTPYKTTYRSSKAAETTRRPSTYETTTLPPACAYWSRWINDGEPEGLLGGDFELITGKTMRDQENFCVEGIISDIECVDANSGVDYDSTGDEELLCDVDFGFSCLNEKQSNSMCRDYKIRYYCSCETTSRSTPTTSRVVTITTPFTTTIAPTTVEPCYELEPILPYVPDEDFKASSSLSAKTGPQYARLDSSSAWTAKELDEDQFLQIDLGFIQPVYGFITKGHATKNEWVKLYHVLYSRDGVSYAPATNLGSKNARLFIGNYNNNKEARQTLDNPFEARFIRIQPMSWSGQISMRVDVLGCAEVITGGVRTKVPSTEHTTLYSVTPPVCDDPMGFENEEITDEQITVSSFRDEYHGPTRIRLHTEETKGGSGGWMSKTLDNKQFIQIDFTEIRTLTGVVTQGRADSGQYVTTYTVEYSNDGKNWYPVTSATTGDKTFNGNYDSNTPVTNYFDHPFRARYLRINPLTWNSWISMRLEVKGCYEPVATTSTTMTPMVLHSTASTPHVFTHVVECDDQMGVENGMLDDSQITVSSSLNGRGSGASRVRLHLEEGIETGGWLAEKAQRDEFVQFDFQIPVNLTGVITQGRAKHNEWVEKYQVQYSLDGEHWENALNVYGKKIFDGNHDGNTPVTRQFSETINARFIRIQPTSWHNWISMRAEILGCYTPEIRATTTPYVEVTKTSIPKKTTIKTSTIKPTPTPKECILYGEWMNYGKPYKGDGDYEPIDELIAKTNLCDKPFEIECRETTTQQEYRTTGQVMKCDLTHGLQCRHQDQKPGYECYDYEARIGCYICPEFTTKQSTPSPSPLPPVRVCPEVPERLFKNCPLYCPDGKYCDGKTCVDPLKCACYVDDKKYLPGDRILTDDCQECECQLDGYSICREKKCPPCKEGLKSVMTPNCKCECESCKDDEYVCPTNGQCLRKELWCDGVVDCPDDEVDCPTTPPTRPTCAPTIVSCPVGSLVTIKNPDDECPEYECTIVPTTTLAPPTREKVVCDMTGNFFRTFDGKDYMYDICDHVLVQEKLQQKFIVTVHRDCDKNNRCSKYLIVVQDSHHLRFGSDLSVEYNYQQYNALQLIKLGRTIQDFSVRIVGNSIIFQSKKYGFEVEWNKQQSAKVKVEGNLMFQVNGLCGLFSKNRKDDFEMPSGKTAKGAQEFGNSWSVGALERCEPKTCESKIKIEAVASCNSLLLPPLSTCNDVIDTDQYFTACVAAMCDCLMETDKKAKECECEAFLPYVEACQKEASPTVKINEWRTKFQCIPSCPPGLVWKDCGSSCERTCNNLQEDLNECSDDCVAGCFCPEGMVKKRNNTCVSLNKCQDCVCDGYGDPHFNTFDRAYYPFQGNCTYVLSRAKAVDGKHKYEVYVTNDECKEEPGTTCITAIMVLYEDHIVHFRINESVTIDGVQLRPSDFPMEYDGINITVTGHPARTIIISIPEIFLEVRYSESNYGFQVKLPSEIYSGEVEGLCADCDHDKSNDQKKKDGELTDDIEEFGMSWLAEPPEGMEIVDDTCFAHPPKPCHNVTEEDKCEAVLSRVFQPCHALVDPEMVLKACKFDMCHSVIPEDSLCRSLAEYARACSQAGVCIQNWRTPTLCPANCPPGMYFDQCATACQKTQKNKDEFDKEEECDLDPVEGCFCNGGLILIEEECREPPKNCDDKNHTIGDTWSPDICSECLCTESLTIECTKTVCPSKPICKKDEILQEIPSNEKNCCPSYSCQPPPVIPCPEVEMPTCEAGEITKTTMDDNYCLHFECVCDINYCPPMREPPRLEVGEEVVIDKSKCCPVKDKICKKENCKAPLKCLPGENLEVVNDWKCCPDYFCVPPQDQCYYKHANGITSEKAVAIGNRKEAFYEPGDTWMDGKCKKCRCDGMTGSYYALCQEETCPPIDEQVEENYVIEVKPVEDKCCPEVHQTMCLMNGTKYAIGETWESPDDDKCKLMQCIEASNGNAIKTTSTVACLEKCPRGQIYEKPPPSSPNCCGSCKGISCVEDGKVYQVGQTWNSTKHACAVAECKRDSSVGVITEYSSACPAFPKNCPIDKIAKSQDGCCDICTEIPFEEACNVQQVDLEDTVRMFRVIHNGEECTNKDALHGFTECVGKCDSHSVYTAGKGDFESTCMCCTPDESEEKTIELDCTDGSKQPFTFKLPKSCACNLCSGAGNFEPPVNYAPIHF